MKRRLADLRPLPVLGCDVHDLDAVEDLADTPGELRGTPAGAAFRAGGLAPQPGNDGELEADHAARSGPSQKLWTMMKNSAVVAWRAQEDRRDEGIADEAADRLDLVLDDGRGLGDLTVRRASGVKRSTMANRSKRMRRSIRSPRIPWRR